MNKVKFYIEVMNRFSPALYFYVLLFAFPFDSLVASNKVNDDFSDRVNLALRQVGHQLLAIEGDALSTIPPVKEINAYKYKLELQDFFNYDTLPAIIHQAFLAYDLKRNYSVAIERCHDNLIILGYNFESYAKGEVACRGREQKSACSNIVVTFSTLSPTTLESENLLNNNDILLGALFLCGLGLIAFLIYGNRKKKQLNTDHNDPTPTLVDQHIVSIGKFRFDHQNQTLQLEDEKQDLTFRESKLLHHLVQHKNEVQTRDNLIENVWADEGVLVGRSLDVFISRLRKLLKADENVKIKNIHGVGYRLEMAG